MLWTYLGGNRILQIFICATFRNVRRSGQNLTLWLGHKSAAINVIQHDCWSCYRTSISYRVEIVLVVMLNFSPLGPHSPGLLGQLDPPFCRPYEWAPWERISDNGINRRPSDNIIQHALSQYLALMYILNSTYSPQVCNRNYVHLPKSPTQFHHNIQRTIH